MLVQLRLDGNKFRSDMGTARSEVKKLESEFKAIKSDQHLTDAGEQLKRNMEEQLKVLDGQILDYQNRISEVKSALSQTAPGSKENKSLTNDILKLETSLNKSKEHANNLKREMEEMFRPEMIDKAAQFVQTMSELSSIGRDAEMAYSFLVGDWAKEAANSADEINVSREQALAMVEKIAAGRLGWYEGWDKDIDRWIQQLITGVPIAYQEAAQAMANGMQAGGVAVDDIQEYTKVFTRMEKATDLTGEEGARQFGKFLTIMETAPTEFEAVASAIVDLGNNVAATESQIVETSTRSASALKAVGMQEADILALSAGALMLGMEPAAAASSLEKLAKKSGASAEFAAKGYGELEARLKSVGREYASFYDLQVDIDRDSDVRRGIVQDLGITSKDLTYLVNQAILAEKWAGLMGQTVEEFAAAWADDPAKYFVSLFDTIGQLDESGAASIFETLAGLGITEIREGRLARNYALLSESLMGVLLMSRQANEEAVALETESQKLFQTTESQRQKNQNKNENFLQAMGEGVTNIRQPWDDFWADFKQNMTQNLPEWATTGMGMVVGALSGLGDVLGGFSRTMQGIYYTGQVYKDLKNVDWKGAKGVFGVITKGAAKAVPYLGAFAGLAAMAGLINDMYVDTTGISEALANVQINIDEESKNRALSAIAEVKAAADGLNNQQLDERYAGTSAVVQRGFGTVEMFSQALGYEQEKADRAIESMYNEYGNKIRALEQELLAAASDADALMIQQQIEQTESTMEAQIQLVKKTYTETLSALYAGAVKAHGGEKATGQLLLYEKEHDALMKLYEAQKMTRNEAEKYLRSEDVYTFLGDLGIETMRQGMVKLPEELIKDLYNTMSMTASDFMTKNGTLMSLVSTMLGEGALDNATLDGLEGYLLQTLQALDLKSVGESGAGNWKSIGEQYMGGLAMGIDAGSGSVVAATQRVMAAMVAAARAALDINSPSRVGRSIGVFWDEGLARGVLAGSKEIEAAMQQTMKNLQQEAEMLSPRVNAVMAAAAGGSGAAGYAGGGGGQRVTQSVVNNYSIGGADIYSQQGVRKLAQQIARLQRSTNGSIGKS